MASGRAMTDPKSAAPAPSSPSGIEAVYLANRDSLLRFLRARGAGADADDLIQELWVRVISHPVGPVMNPLGYLYRCANNLMLNACRTSARSSARDEAWGEVHLTGDVGAAEAGLVAREEIARARRRLADCGERVQEVFFLFRVEGMSQREISARFDVSVSAVEKDIQRAYRAIAAMKDEECD